MRKIFLAAALIALASLEASGVSTQPKGPPVNLGIPSSAPVTAAAPFSLLSPESQTALSGPTTTIPSTPIIMAPSILNNRSVYPQSQGTLGPGAQSNIGVTLGFPLGSAAGQRGTKNQGNAASNMLMERANAK